MIDANYNVVGYPPQYLAAQVITQRMGAADRCAAQAVQGVERRQRCGGKCDGDGLCCRAARRAMVGDAGESRPVQRSRGENFFRRRSGKHERHFSGQLDRITFGSNEYQWHREGAGGHADPDGPPAKSTVQGSADALYQLPKASITVLRGQICRMIQASSSESELHVEILTKEEVFVLRMVILQGRSLGRA